LQKLQTIKNVKNKHRTFSSLKTLHTVRPTHTHTHTHTVISSWHDVLYKKC